MGASHPTSAARSGERLDAQVPEVRDGARPDPQGDRSLGLRAGLDVVDDQRRLLLTMHVEPRPVAADLDLDLRPRSGTRSTYDSYWRASPCEAGTTASPDVRCTGPSGYAAPDPRRARSWAAGRTRRRSSSRSAAGTRCRRSPGALRRSRGGSAGDLHLDDAAREVEALDHGELLELRRSSGVMLGAGAGSPWRS